MTTVNYDNHDHRLTKVALTIARALLPAPRGLTPFTLTLALEGSFWWDGVAPASAGGFLTPLAVDHDRGHTYGIPSIFA